MHITIGFDNGVARGGRHPGGPVDIESRAVLLGEPTGLYPDGWTRAHAAFTFLALDRVASLSLELWSPEEPDPLMLTLKTGEAEAVTLIVPRGRVSVLQFPLHAAPFSEFRVELIAERERELSATDARCAAYKLRCIGLH